MRSPEEIANWLLENIVHVYLRPRMYACTQFELDGRLGVLHHTWAYATDRLEDYYLKKRPFGKPEVSALAPDGFFDRTEDPAAYDAIIMHWQALDERLGLELPELPESNPNST